MPTQPRYTRGIRHDKRFSLQARVDFQATDDLVVFASYNPNIRKFDYQDYHLNIGRPSGSTDANGAISTNITNAVVNDNHYVTQYDMVVGQGTGTVSSLDRGSQVRDIVRNIEQNYTQIGADWNPGLWTIKGRAQYSVSRYDRQDEAFFFYVPLSSATFSLIPENGLWSMSPDAAVDLESAGSYYPQLAADGFSRTSSLEYTPQADRNTEWNFQLDVTREFDNLGPLASIKFGAQHRRRDNNAYREGGTQIQPGVVQSRARSLDLVRFCSPALASPSAPCEFGSTRRTTTAGTTDQLYKIHTLTEEQYQKLINTTLMQMPGKDFLAGLPNRGDLLTSWMAFDAKKLVDTLRQYVDLSNHTLDCLYECIASDGQVYERPTYNTNEYTTSAYAMADFTTDVRGVIIDGNIGVRYQRIDVAA